MFGSNEVTTGGTALRFYASVRLEIRRAGQLKNDGEPHGSRIKVKVVKNKLAPPFGVVRPYSFSPIISVGGTGLWLSSCPAFCTLSTAQPSQPVLNWT